MQKSILYLLLCLGSFSSCVTPKVYNSLLDENEAVKQALKNQEKEGIRMQSQIEELEGEIMFLRSKIQNLKNDSILNGRALIALQDKYESLDESYDLLTSKNSRQIAEKAK